MIDFNGLRTFEMGEQVFVCCRNNEAFALVEYIGRGRNGKLKFESCTYGDIYTMNKDQTKFTMGSKTYDVDYIS